MKPEIAKRWVEALRSGQYPQTTRVLCRLDAKGEPTGFCCLGVLCDIAERDGVVKFTQSVAADNLRRVYYTDSPGAANSCTTVLPAVVMRWAEIKTDTGIFGEDMEQFDDKSLVRLNDKGASFAEIADIIEKHVEDL